MLTKMVDGQEVALSEQEEKKVRDEWAAYEVSKTMPVEEKPTVQSLSDEVSSLKAALFNKRVIELGDLKQKD